MVFINSFNGQVIISRIFDTYKNGYELDNFLENDLPHPKVNYIVVAACKDDCAGKLSIQARNWFESMGSKRCWKLDFR